ncbi:hypothetical protein A3K73_02880 [Candidatus Pacearchaeota archaeon RBG_13_36_9]|nr:MAG: hypothetical protein A3K73_02880 [Candidatus Pacearchaeota archaeon RBG_13_36_9]
METRKTNWRLRIKMAAVAGLAAIVGAANLLVSGCGSNNKLVDKCITKPYVETALVSDYVARHGMMVEGQVRQDLVNLNVNDRFSAFVWQNYSYKENDFNERDFGFSYNLPVTDKVSVRGGYEFWDYPSGTFGDYDNVLKAGAHYSGKLDLDFDLTHLLPTETTPESGTRYYFKASKNFPVGNLGDFDVSLTPSISTAIIDNYYRRTGHSQVTPGLNLGVAKKNWSLNLFLNAQDAKIPAFKNKMWSGASLAYKF